MKLGFTCSKNSMACHIISSGKLGTCTTTRWTADRPVVHVAYSMTPETHPQHLPACLNREHEQKFRKAEAVADMSSPVPCMRSARYAVKKFLRMIIFVES